ncbi:IS1096 element passenger TnpR family protein [Halarchaeum nitratireducens]|uniref:Uncharacterized protein n=1 Tax=Halarchaeum nitratireducens TaxID=489913 RepID=A0A830GG25_9EURY|nr:hypothetical protein [Halarchaeum nitratireducens]GGN25284.1 hypothetical protein GCM10009021_29040 [Halarchaeum nitratireducens]
MTAYRFRVKFAPDPTSLWRDIVVGADRTLDEFQTTINAAMGLNQDHLWFFGIDEDYWESDVKYQCPAEHEDLPSGQPMQFGETTYSAGATTVGELVAQLDLDQYDRICYLFDYGDEWRFYAILKEVVDDPDRRAPEVVKEKGDEIDQYASAGEDGSPLPDRLQELGLPDTAVPTADLRALEDRDDVAHVIVLLSIETGFGTVSERFMIQFDDVGYLLENSPRGWEVIEEVDGGDKTEEALLSALVSAAREWHAEIAEIASAASGQVFDDQTVEAMNVELNQELERTGYSHL